MSQNFVAPQVVLVDGDAALRAALKFSLELDGFDVDIRDSAEALLSMSLPETDACLLVDYFLPGITGLEALQRLRRRGVRLPALLMTSGPALRLREATQAGFAIVEKPLLGDNLVDGLRTAMRQAMTGAPC